MVRRLRQELYRFGSSDLWMAIAASAIATLMIVAATEVQGQTFQVLHTFTGGDDGANPLVGLTMDRAGNLYGTAQYGGTGSCPDGASTPGCGTVFKLSHRGSGWTFASLYSFQGWNATDGAYPQSRVTVAPDGTLYGATPVGGLLEDCFPGCGTAYRLQPPANICNSVSCQWTETVLHRFTAGEDGNDPTGDLTLDATGDVYGTTVKGGSGSYGNGTVYEISPSGGGWNESILYNFVGGLVGAAPYSGVILDAAGNLDGTSTDGGYYDQGTVFQLTPSGSGWAGSAIYSFTGNNDGYDPAAGLILDGSGNLYSATPNGRPSGQAVVYELSPFNGGWSFFTIHEFENEYGGGPVGKLLMDSAGNLYGTTVGGYESTSPHGSVFKLTPRDGGWIYTDLYDFTGGSDGAFPYDGLVVDAQGNLYGTTEGGGNSGCQDNDGCGVVFEITP